MGVGHDDRQVPGYFVLYGDIVRYIYAGKGIVDDTGDFDEWSARWQRRLEREATVAEDRAAAMRKVNPAVIPRNHLVERALDMASLNDDFSQFEDLLAVLQHPFRSPDTDEYTLPPEEDERVLKTFCGT